MGISNMESKENTKKGSKNILSKILCSIGVGGILTYYLVSVSEEKLIYTYQLIKEALTTGKFDYITDNIPVLIMLSLSIFALLLCPLLIKNGKGLLLKIYILTGLFLINGFSIVIVAARGEVPTLFLIIVWVSISYIIWVIIDVAKIVYCWARSGGEVDVVKLTFVWAMIAFILSAM